jgi:pyruvate dehydrogenase E1 component beta subunit
LVVVHEGHKTAGVGAEIAQTAVEGAFDYLQAAIRRVASEDQPIPTGTLQDIVFPNTNKIMTACREAME